MAIRPIPFIAAGGIFILLVIVLQHSSGSASSLSSSTYRALKEMSSFPAAAHECPVTVCAEDSPGEAHTQCPPQEVCSSSSKLRLDPLGQAGWVDADGWWKPAAAELVNPHVYQTLINSKDVEEYTADMKVDWIRNKRILFLGDSVCRDVMMRFCAHMGDTTNSLTDCYLPSLNFTAYSMMLHGFADYYKLDNLTDILSDEWPVHHLDFETRIEHAFGQMPHPDVVIVNGGAWDFKYMFQRDVFYGHDHKNLPMEDLTTYASRSRKFLTSLRAQFPTQKLFWLELHPFSTKDENAKAAWISGNSQSGKLLRPSNDRPLPSLFTPSRVNQLSQTYRQAVQEADFMDTLDYFKISNSFTVAEFIRGGDAIHPSEGSIKALTDILLWKLWWEEMKAGK